MKISQKGTLWIFYFINDTPRAHRRPPPAKREREREAAPLRCTTVQKNGHHSVNFGPILAIFGSKWPQRIDLSFGTVFLMQKWLENAQIIERKGHFWPAFPFQFRPITFWWHFEQFVAIFALKNMVSYYRFLLCGHLEPKMAKIGPKLSEWWPFF